MRTPPRMLVIFTLATALVVGGIIALATGSWWILPVAVGLHAVGTVLVLVVTGKALTQYDKPDPNVEARADADGEAESDPDEPRMAI
jgi:membrane protein implicated in regulation of membrane protease activity